VGPLSADRLLEVTGVTVLQVVQERDDPAFDVQASRLANLGGVVAEWVRVVRQE
jgi:hypothetical protein